MARRVALLAVALLAVALSLSACPPPLVNRPVTFSAANLQADPIQPLVRTLVANGQSVAQVDPQAGIIQTRWENTGFGYGFVEVEVPYPHTTGATIWRRYSVILVPQPAGAQVTVRADTQRCAQDAASLDGINLTGSCTRLGADGLVPDHQQQLEDLAAQLRGAIGGS